MATVQVLVEGKVDRQEEGNVIWTSVALVQSESYRILFDVGEFHQRFVLKRRLKAIGWEPSDIDWVVLSHLHWDHALNFEMFHTAQFIITPEEWSSVQTDTPRDVATPTFLFPALRNAVDLTTTDQVTWPMDIEVVPTPGHTMGHLALVVGTPAGTVGLAGDACPDEQALDTGIPDPIFYNRDQACESLNRLVSMSDILVPGHGPAFYTASRVPAGRLFDPIGGTR